MKSNRNSSNHFVSAFLIPGSESQRIDEIHRCRTDSQLSGLVFQIRLLLCTDARDSDMILRQRRETSADNLEFT
jgi:hypothetical protein